MRFSVLIPYRDEPGRTPLFDWVYNWWRVCFPEAEVCLGSDDSLPFNRGKARNDAFARASTDLMVIADADTVPNPSAVDEALRLVCNDACWVLPYAKERYYNLSQMATAFVLMGGVATIPEPTSEEAWEHKITSWAGCLVIRRESWELVGGYDERFVGWGFEDNAIVAAFDLAVGPHRRVDSYICHLWHPRGEDFDNPHLSKNRRLMERYRAAKSVEEMLAWR